MFGFMPFNKDQPLRGSQKSTPPTLPRGKVKSQKDDQIPVAFLTKVNQLTQSTKTFKINLKNRLKGVIDNFLGDVQIIFERDPAARNWLEVICCYPGLHAITLHRFAHWLNQQGMPFLPRFLSHIGRFLTGIEIHPGATLGRGVFIDHGMGVVIGETAIVGDYCLIYQNVTLGGTGKESGKRHPTLGNHVVVGTGAKVLGNISLGDQVRVGAGSIVLQDVPNDCTVVGVPGRIISRTGQGCPLEHGKLPDVEAKVIRSLLDRIEQIEQQLQQKSQSGDSLLYTEDNQQTENDSISPETIVNLLELEQELLFSKRLHDENSKDKQSCQSLLLKTNPTNQRRLGSAYRSGPRRR